MSGIQFATYVTNELKVGVLCSSCIITWAVFLLCGLWLSEILFEYTLQAAEEVEAPVASKEDSAEVDFEFEWHSVCSNLCN